MRKILQIFIPLLPFVGSLTAQTKKNRLDKEFIQTLNRHISILASDSMEGRRAGTAGEQRASSYISNQFQSFHLQPKGKDGSFLQPFLIPDDKRLSKSSRLTINGQQLAQESDFNILTTSGNGSVKVQDLIPGKNEKNKPWIIDLKSSFQDQSTNPHFDIKAALFEKADIAEKSGATAVLFIAADPNVNMPQFDPKYNGNTFNIPVILIYKNGFEKIQSSHSAQWDIQMNITLEKNFRTAHNVIGYLDRHAPFTIIIGAHYDHLGYGEDGNSMNRSGPPDIHNGADDNASGTSTLLLLAMQYAREKKFKTYNLLFIAFSGEELGLLGSRYFSENPTIELSKVTAMFNMDMVGRMVDSSYNLTLGGFGTSPSWSEYIFKADKAGIQLKFDSSGTGPSDHTSFYRKDIPVLFFFTGLHTDYHKPSDDAEKINSAGMLRISKFIRSIIDQTEPSRKLIFTKTREQQTSTSARFTVSMGIMPDYSYAGSGVKIDGISEGRAAQKVGIMPGDILIELGSNNVSSVESYMQALSKFKKGDVTTVTILRKDSKLTFKIIF